MVNRRLLRVKAFQQLYAFYTQERAQYQLAFDGLATIFQPDLSLMVAKEDQMPRLEGLRQLAEIQLKEYFQEITSEETIPAEAQDAAQSVYKLYQANVKQIAKKLKQDMVSEVESINKQYLKILYYLQQLPLIALWDENRRLLENNTKTSLLAKTRSCIFFPNGVIYNVPSKRTTSAGLRMKKI